MSSVFKIEAVLGGPDLSSHDDVLPGKVWIVLDDLPFPEVGWSGAVDSVLGSMISAVSELQAGEGRAISHFPDGRCYLSFESLPPVGGDRVHVAANCRKTTPAGEPSGTLSVRELAVEVHRVVDRLWAQCLQQDPGGNAVELLGKLCVEARALLWREPHTIHHRPGVGHAG